MNCGADFKTAETWLKTDKLYKLLRQNNMDVVTITNHNNARSAGP
ncbi:MAG: hypothetical protein R3D86_13560 [Emcibacteraceae bacterium]